MRRTKASLIYRRTKNLREVELLLGHTKLESTVQFGLPGGPGFEPRLTESEFAPTEAVVGVLRRQGLQPDYVASAQLWVRLRQNTEIFS